ncbi:hypothetical protein [uncultured Desulfobacter sp.]|uniref:hypothetical protein n=1 Tax=uncultured Desulfobacter sp. TaxID=240139 RepID=UPI0029F4AE02|nr:hypothetical protein [uncultured Desulfobacter sp.]
MDHRMAAMVNCSTKTNQAFNKKIETYKRQKRNLFSYTEKIMAAMMCPDLYLELMPKQYRDRPMAAYFKALDSGQRSVVQTHYGSI